MRKIIFIFSFILSLLIVLSYPVNAESVVGISANLVSINESFNQKTLEIKVYNSTSVKYRIGWTSAQLYITTNLKEEKIELYDFDVKKLNKDSNYYLLPNESTTIIVPYDGEVEDKIISMHFSKIVDSTMPLNGFDLNINVSYYENNTGRFGGIGDAAIPYFIVIGYLLIVTLIAIIYTIAFLCKKKLSFNSCKKAYIVHVILTIVILISFPLAWYYTFTVSNMLYPLVLISFGYTLIFKLIHGVVLTLKVKKCENSINKLYEGCTYEECKNIVTLIPTLDSPGYLCYKTKGCYRTGYYVNTYNIALDSNGNLKRIDVSRERHWTVQRQF